MDKNYAVSEIIGVILLIGIIVSAFSIFAAIYLPMIIPNAIPQVKLTMACSSDGGDGDDIEYPCNIGGFSCSDDPFDYEMCKNDCKTRFYSEIYPDSSDNHNVEILRCLEDCMVPICSDLGNCNVMYICHNGGDSLVLDNLEIIVNNGVIPKEEWKVQKPGDIFSTPPIDEIFQVGSTIRFTREDSTIPVDRVIVIYRPSHGGEYTLVSNQFGTDIN